MKKNWKEIIVAVFFCCFLGFGFFKSNATQELALILSSFQPGNDSGKDLATVEELETDFSSELWMKSDLIDINGAMAKTIDVHGLYSDMDMYILDGGYIVSAYDYTTTDYEYLQMVEFRDFLAENHINLLYINEPAKYTDDNLLLQELGVETYTNRNADVFLKRIGEAGIPYIDLRQCMEEDGLTARDLFYRTDHHWTAPAGLWATKKIAEGLNGYCGYQIDTSLYHPQYYTIKEWKNCWLGEQGKKFGATYTGLDDYVEVKPAFETSFTFKGYDKYWQGTFDDFVNEIDVNDKRSLYDRKSWHYSYDRINCINNNVPTGKVLLLCDSYAHVTQPFLSLGVREVDSIIWRDYGDGLNLRKHIIDHGYDTVIVAYAQFMIGAHDDENSANYKMFSLE